jgi:PrcB C-terminal
LTPGVERPTIIDVRLSSMLRILVERCRKRSSAHDGFQLALILGISLTACGRSPTAPDVPFRVIGHGGLNGSMRSAQVIARNTSWAEFVERTNLRAQSFRPEDPLPAIDFNTEMAIALFLGVSPTSGYQIRVDRVDAEGDVLIVHALEIVPCAGATVLTYPLSVIAVPRSDRTVAVSWARQPPQCGG